MRIIHKYGCCIYPNIQVGKGFFIAHPIGIVIGNCTIGENFCILQNCTIGVKSDEDNETQSYPQIGNNVTISASSLILGPIKICDNVTIGANSLVIHDIVTSGVYVGSPVRQVK